MLFASKSLILLVLFGASFCYGLFEDEKRSKEDSNNCLKRTKREDECASKSQCWDGYCRVSCDILGLYLWCFPRKNNSNFLEFQYVKCKEDHECDRCSKCSMLALCRP